MSIEFQTVGQQGHVNGQGNGNQGPKYQIDIEGTEYPWNADTITAEDITRLAGWPAGTTVVEVDEKQGEITLAPNQPVEVKPGHGFGKKVKFKRG